MFLKPKALPYDPIEWSQKPYAEQLRIICQTWATRGYGSPVVAYLFYAVKMVAYVYVWMWFCSFNAAPSSSGAAAADRIDFVSPSWTDWSWALHPVAFQKAIAWSMLFEVLGLGCGSGPLTGRFLPSFGGFLYWLRPGTTKLPLSWIEGWPLVGGLRRNIIDIALYAALVVSLVLSLIHPAPGFAQWLPIVVLVPVLGVLDKPIFLAARAEHYWVTVTLFAFATNWIAGAMWVQLALWFFAGFSKLNNHFPTVVCVMTSNGPFTPWQWFRKSMYRRYPDDLNPSASAVAHARVGTALELAVAIVIGLGALTGEPTVLGVGLILMLLLHAYILSNVPMGVPLEWNVLVVYGGLFLFWANGDVSPMEVRSWSIGLFLFVWAFALPVIGNLRPPWISFLLAMRYYAGNWPASVWLFKKDAVDKFKTLTRSAPWISDQLRMLYDEQMAVGMTGMTAAFRLMHLHGRAIQKAVPMAIDTERYSDYVWVEGELVAGMALGWNFGDGHLHQEQLLRNLQAQCGFEEGELRCVFVEGQSLLDYRLPYRIADAKTGLMHSDAFDVRDLQKAQGWPTGTAPADAK